MSMSLGGQLPPEHSYNQQEAANFNIIAKGMQISPVDENVKNAVKINLNGQIAFYDRRSLEMINKQMERLKARNITDLTQIKEALLPDGIASIIAGYVPDGFQVSEERPNYPEDSDIDTDDEREAKADAGAGTATAAADAKAAASAKDQGAKEAAAAADPAAALARVSSWAAGAPFFEDNPTFQELDTIEEMYRVFSGRGDKAIEINTALKDLAKRLGISKKEVDATDNIFTLIRFEMAKALIRICQAFCYERPRPNQFEGLLPHELLSMSPEEKIRHAREMDKQIRLLRPKGPEDRGENSRGILSIDLIMLDIFHLQSFSILIIFLVLSPI